MPGEPEEELEAEGGGRGPCCWATAGKANAVAVQARKTMNLAVYRWDREEFASFADVFILSTPIFSGLLPV
jgi:hypothetical protein